MLLPGHTVCQVYWQPLVLAVAGCELYEPEVVGVDCVRDASDVQQGVAAVVCVQLGLCTTECSAGLLAAPMPHRSRLYATAGNCQQYGVRTAVNGNSGERRYTVLAVQLDNHVQ
jgi:hypothetical protein